MAILVTGGAGYIGSHTVLQLLGMGERVVVLDDLSKGHRELVSSEAKLYIGDYSDSELVKKIIKSESIDSVIHFGAFIVVPESVIDPFKYYENNFSKSLKLIKTCFQENVNKFIFSSTAAVYGDCKKSFINEKTETVPMNAYGNSKLSVEKLLRDVANIPKSEFQFVVLRYFNVAGANLEGKTGQISKNSTHLIKVAAQAALGIRKKMVIYGADYATKDGTCIRDYIHVEDLAYAHLLSLNYLRNGGSSDIFNCGYGKGFSVKEVINIMKEVSGVDFVTEIADRRVGDIEKLIADPTLIKSTLNWNPKYNDLKLICNSALKWEKKSMEIFNNK